MSPAEKNRTHDYSKLNIELPANKLLQGKVALAMGSLAILILKRDEVYGLAGKNEQSDGLY